MADTMCDTSNVDDLEETACHSPVSTPQFLHTERLNGFILYEKADEI